MDSTKTALTDLEEQGNDLEELEELEELEVQETDSDASGWEWEMPAVTELPCGIHTSDMIFGDAPVVAVIGKRSGQPLTRRICYISRNIVPTGVDVEENIEVLFTFFDAIISFEGEESAAVRQRIDAALRILNILPAPDEVWECSTEVFKSNAKFFNRLYRGVISREVKQTSDAAELIAFAFPYEAERFDSFKTWRHAVNELNRATGVPMAKELYRLYDTETEIRKFMGFIPDQSTKTDGGEDNEKE